MFSLVLSRGQKHFSEQFKTVDIQKSNSNTDLKISLRDLRGYFFLMMILPTGRILLILQCDYLPHYGSLNSYCFLNCSEKCFCPLERTNENIIEIHVAPFSMSL